MCDSHKCISGKRVIDVFQISDGSSLEKKWVDLFSVAPEEELLEGPGKQILV